TVIDEDTRELVADDLVHDGRGNSRVDTAGQPTDKSSRADLCTHRADGFVDDVHHRPRRTAGGAVVQEPFEYVEPTRRVHNLGMELHAVETARRNFEPGDRC